MTHQLTYGPTVGVWTAGKLGCVFDSNSAEALGLEKDGDLKAGVIYENYNGRSVMCHIAIDGRMTPEYLAYIYDYPFRQLNVEKIIVPVDSTNEKSIRLVTGMGFTEEARLRDAAPDGDVVFFVMNKSDCRFIGDRYGQKLKRTSRT